MDSLWQDLRPKHWPALAGDLEVDAVVVGGGLAGVSAALALASYGQRVILVEGGRLGQGASGRNAGFLLGGAADDFLTLAAARGRAVAEMMAKLAEQNRRLVKAALEEAGGGSVLEGVGSFALAVDPAEAEHLVRLGETLRELGYSADPAEPEMAGPTLRQAGYLGGLFFPADAQLHPLRLVYALAAGAERQGVSIYEGSPVEAVSSDGTGVSVKAAGATVRAGVCILAVNADLARLFPPAAAWITPARAQMLASRPLPRPVLSAPVYAGHGFRYFRQDTDGRLLIGGFRNLAVDAETSWDLELNPQLQDRLERELALLAPDAEVERRWAGIMAFTPDHLPVVGALGSHLWSVGGFSGHGLALAPLLGRQVAEMALGRRPPYPALSPQRFGQEVGS